jgi:hypothetical protein
VQTGTKPTNRRIIIEVGEDTFKVDFEGEFSVGEAYAVFLGCLEETEVQMEDIAGVMLDKPVSGVLH